MFMSSPIDALNSGSRWTTPTVTYSFYRGGAHYDPAITQNRAVLSPVSAGIQNSIRQILDELETFINVDFQEIAENGTDASPFGQIRIQSSTNPDYAESYYPGSLNLNGDAFFNTQYDVANLNDINAFQNGIGSYGYSTLIHELGHAIGLKHPGNYNGSEAGDPPFLSYSEDNTDNTVMTYNTVGESNSSWMPYDVLALQSIYGARAWNPTNTTYTFTTTSAFGDGSRNWGSNARDSKLTLWDSGGIDTLNFAGLAAYAPGYRFDLNPAGWLSRVDDFNSTFYRAEGDIANTSYIGSVSGTRLAFGVEIESIIGSSSRDQVTGNSLNNTIGGGDGNDILFGVGGNDSITGGVLSDLLAGGDGNDEFIFGGATDPFYASGIDTVLDFAAGDKLLLSQATFTTLTDIASQFASVVLNADTSSALIVYDQSTSGLFYNPNGSAAGFGGGGQFAVINNTPFLTANDFRLIA
jgi:serralysin